MYFLSLNGSFLYGVSIKEDYIDFCEWFYEFLDCGIKLNLRIGFVLLCVLLLIFIIMVKLFL